MGLNVASNIVWSDPVGGWKGPSRNIGQIRWVETSGSESLRLGENQAQPVIETTQYEGCEGKAHSSFPDPITCKFARIDL